MPNERSADAGQEDEPVDPLIDRTVKAGGNRQPPPNPVHATAPNNEGDSAEIQREIRTGEIWLIGIGIAGILISVAIFWVYSQQLDQMRIATEANTKALQLAQDSFETSGGDFDRTMRQMIHQTAAQVQSARAAQNQIAASMEISYQEQRPWVGIKLVPISAAPSSIELHREETVVAVASNTGRTPALHWKKVCEISVENPTASDTCEGLRERERQWGITQRISQIMSQGTGRTPEDIRRQVEEQSARDMKFGEQSSAQVYSGDTIVPGDTADISLYMIQLGGVGNNRVWVATFTYSDAIEPTRQHITHVCLKQLALNNWVLCGVGQEMK